MEILQFSSLEFSLSRIYCHGSSWFQAVIASYSRNPDEHKMSGIGVQCFRGILAQVCLQNQGKNVFDYTDFNV